MALVKNETVKWRIQTPGNSLTEGNVEVLMQDQINDNGTITPSGNNTVKSVPIAAVQAEFNALLAAIEAYQPSQPPAE